MTETTTQPATTQPTTRHAVRLAGLHKNFGEVRAVDGVDLEIAPGEIVAVLGPNGAGKSTAIDMMLGLTAPDGGTVELFGRSPRQAVADGLVGAMLQTGMLLEHTTVREIVALFAAAHRKPLPVDEVLRQAGIDDLAKRRVTQLSGGQAQRVRFALALVPDPDLLVLDEPTVAMDVTSRREFWSAMRALTVSGRTVLFATHYLDEADQFADRIVLMRNGRIIADGAPSHIKSIVTVRTIRATVPDLDPATLDRLFGSVADVTVADDGAVQIRTADSDGCLRILLQYAPAARDIEIAGADLDTAFMTLTEGAS